MSGKLPSGDAGRRSLEARRRETSTVPQLALAAGVEVRRGWVIDASGVFSVGTRQAGSGQRCWRRSVALLVITLSTACDLPTQYACPAGFRTSGPTFMIREVRSVDGRTTIPTVYVKGGVIGQADTPALLLPLGEGASEDGDRVRCNVACLLSRYTGEVRLTFSAAGFHDTTLTTVFSYTKAEYSGRCLHSMSGPTEFRLRMRPL